MNTLHTIPVRCEGCGIIHVPSFRKAMAKDFKAVRSFLGTNSGEKLTKNELKYIFILEVILPDKTKTIIGTLIAIPFRKNNVYLGRMRIAETFREQGLARHLLTNVIRHAKENKFAYGYAITTSPKADSLLMQKRSRELTQHEFALIVPQELFSHCSDAGHRYWKLTF